MKSQPLSPSQKFHGFTVERVEEIPELRSQAVIFTHDITKARVFHLYNEDPNNLFSIAFRTPVFDNTGVPHILEHSVLCGSRKFPVKDPFQELLKGSLQTFLNALTYPDKTVYPVSSQVEADFYNLVNVYCDAVFHPLLTEHTFLQEGWHFDLNDPKGPVDIKGIVYNEMKGVFSDFSSHVVRRTFSSLFPDSTYFFESGGEPEHIVDLTYKGLKDFHSKYYHPSNSFIFLYGNLPSEKTLQFLQENYLHEYDHLAIDSRVPLQKAWTEPRKFEISAPAPEQDEGKATVALAWMFCDATDAVTTLAGRILFRYLVGTDTSPLRRALIDSGLGEDLDDITGFDGDVAQTVVAVGLRKSDPQNAEKVQELILSTLEQQITQGLDERLLEGCIRQMEFGLREISGGRRFPHNLKLADRCYRSWLYEGDPLTHLRFEEPIESIKKAFQKDKDYFKAIIRDRLLQNPHRLLSVVTASSEEAKRFEQQTATNVKEMTRDFTDADKERFYNLSQQLLDEQKKPPAPEKLATLPKLRKDDLPKENKLVPTEHLKAGHIPVYAHPLFTSEIVYVDVGFDFSRISPELLPYLPVFLEYITRCGAAGKSYQDMSREIALSTGGIHSSVVCTNPIDQNGKPVLRAFFHGKALPARVGEMTGILVDLFTEPDLANKKQLRDIVLEMRNERNSSIVGAGNGYAMTHAASRLSTCASIEEQLHGISNLRFLDELALTNDMDSVAKNMQSLHRELITSENLIISLTNDAPEQHIGHLEHLVKSLPESSSARGLAPKPEGAIHSLEGIEISASINFVARAWGIQEVTPARAGRLSLLARHMSTGYLWDKVRVEGGAYGGNAAFSSSDQVFLCSSYRDPNLASTLSHFDNALENVREELTEERLEQSIIGAIGRIDSPKSPHSQGYSETLSLLSGRTQEYRQNVREAILSTTVDDLKASAQEIADEKQWSVAVLGSPSAFERAQSEGIVLTRTPLLPKRTK